MSSVSALQPGARSKSAREGVTDRLLRLRSRWPWVALAVALGWVVLAPLVRLQQRAMEDGASAYSRLLDEPRLGETITYTVALAAGSVVLAVTIGTGVAWGAYNLPSRWRWLAIVPLVTLMVPPLAQVSGWAFLLAPRVGYLNSAARHLPWWDHLAEGPIDIYSAPAIVGITGFMLVAFVYLFVYTALQGMDVTLTEAAHASGATTSKTFRYIVWPLLRPAILYSTTIVLLLGLGQFTAPLLLGRQEGIDVVTTEMYRAANTFPLDYGLAAAYGSPIIFVGGILILVQRLALRDESRYQTLNSRGHRTGTRGSSLAILPLAAYGIVAVLLPLVGLLIVALSPFWSGSIDVRSMSLRHVWAVLDDPLTWQAIWTSIRASLVALAIVLPIGYLTAIGVWDRRRSGRMVGSVLDVLASVPLVMPAVLFGAGILFAYSEGPIVLYGTTAALVVAYVTLTIPHVSRVVQSGLVGMGQTLVEAARSCGAGTWRTHLTVILPSIRQSIGAAGALTMALLSHEFAASVMVRSPQTEVMGTLLYRYWTTGSTPAVAVIALIMCTVTVVMVGLALAIGGRRSLEHF